MSLRTAVQNVVPTMHGWCSVPKALAMYDLIVATQPEVIVEIGVFGGRSLVPQAMALKVNGHGKIYGIDPWINRAALEGDIGKENADWWSQQKLNEILESASSTIWQHGLEEHAILLRCGSQHCPELFPTIDILHIDGNHGELASCRDVDTYLPKVKPGGYIWFDDIDWSTAGAAYKKFCEATNPVTFVEKCELRQKPN